ncbi:hypothetical protein, partial [Micromonospora saelicesensis]|uniref:hypothetical protein n=1 Tax=Micromonospora saelicesensis TaxID=285676 RepID=UPI00283AB2AE
MGIGRTTQRDQASGHSRRKLLSAGALLVLGGAVTPLTGCDLFDRDDQPAPPPDPLRPMVDESLALAAAYRASATAHPELADRLDPIAETHTAHATELARVIGVTVPSAASAAGALIGGVSGAAAGLGGRWGRWIDTTLMRFIDMLLAMPSLLLAVSIAALPGASLPTVMIAVGVVSVPVVARL